MEEDDYEIKKISIEIYPYEIRKIELDNAIDILKNIRGVIAHNEYIATSSHDKMNLNARWITVNSGIESIEACKNLISTISKQLLNEKENN